MKSGPISWLPYNINSIQHGISPYRDAYVKASFHCTNDVLNEATSAVDNGRQASATQLFLSVTSLYRLSQLCPTKPLLRWRALEIQKAAYTLATPSWIDLISEVLVPRNYRKVQEGPLVAGVYTSPNESFRPGTDTHHDPVDRGTPISSPDYVGYV